MRVLFACGGTAGHINPAVGVAGRIMELWPESEILFVGAKGKMELELVPQEGFPIRGVAVSSLSRSLSPKAVSHNVRAACEIVTSQIACRSILKEFRPDVVIGTGGYVCYPVLHQAAKLGIPTAVHESNAQPGLTTRKLEGCVDRIMVGFEEARENYRHPDKVTVTGTPVRLDFLRETRSEARCALGIAEDTPLVLSVWGSLGATEMNKKVGEMIALAMQTKAFRLVHSAGKRGIEGMTAHMRDTLGLAGWNEAGFEVRDYISDMPRLMAAADVVLCRSGASTLAELAALGKPAVLVPSPNVVNNHQERNARVLERAGAAVVLPESEATAEAMLAHISALLSDRARLDAMGENMRAISVGDATDRIVSIARELTGM